MAERRIMAQIRHPFIVPLIFAFQSQEKLYMVTEYCSGGELFFHLKRLKRFKEKDARFYIAEVACALSHLHAYDVIYRDLKPENILLDGEGHVKLTDFGLSKDDVFGDNELGAASESYPNSPRMSDASGGEHRHSTVLPTTRTFCGTPEYLAPEMILNRKRHTGYSLAIDWWSLGIVAYEMLTGWPPFFDRNFNVMCEKILRKPVKLPSKYKISENCADFVCKGLLQRDPLLRLGNTADGFSGIEKHPYFNDLNWNDLRSRQVTPPFVPPRGHGRPEEDVRNVDKEFLKMAALDTPTNPSSLINGALDKSDPDFKDFSFVDSVLS
jgi:serine/threonine protein kinase